MNVSTALCLRCGQIGSGTCPHCGSPLDATPAPRPPVRPAPSGPAYSFPPAVVHTGGPELRLSRKAWVRLGAAGGAVLLALAAFLLLWEPPSPSGAVQGYLEALADGDTATALTLSGYGTGFSPDEAPLLVPAVLADEANRPSRISVTSTRELDAESRYSVVTAAYHLGGQPVQQQFAVFATEDDETPFRLENPFLFLSVNLPQGMTVSVNGVAVDPSAVTYGTAVFPGLYHATTEGNALFAGATRTAAYGSGRQGSVAEIDLSGLAVAPGAAAAVQTAAETYLNTNCVTETNRYGCPLRAPLFSWSQQTNWTVTAYPQVQVVPEEAGRPQLRFSTGTAGIAAFTTSYTDFDGTATTETGTVPIDITGSAAIGDDGAIEIRLGY